jgi:hypothetical protein
LRDEEIKPEILPLRGCFAIGREAALKMTGKGKPEVLPAKSTPSGRQKKRRRGLLFVILRPSLIRNENNI